MANVPIAAGTRVGHVHLKVADLDRALGFYQGVLGFQLMQRFGTQAAFISAGGSSGSTLPRSIPHEAASSYVIH